ncbi:MAG TPA: PAS domain S-box protein [Methylocella sp.]|nr:PAS domain S-box protein [Methylocella sp.]
METRNLTVAQASGIGARLDVLLIDDTPQDRLGVRLALEGRGFVVKEAATAGEGLKLAATFSPDCILLDQSLPDLDGLQALERLRRPDGLMPCAVIMLTSDADADVATAAMKAGALDCLIKSRFDAYALILAIRGAVRLFQLAETQRQTERQLRESEARLRLAQDVVGLGHWEFDFRTGEPFWSAQARELIGVGADEPASLDLFISRVHPDDRPEIEREAIRSRDPRAAHDYHVEFRVLLPDGSMRWLEDKGRVEFGAKGRPLRAFGAVRDITARKQREEALRESENFSRSVFESSPDCLKILTLDGVIEDMNRNGRLMMEIDDFSTICGRPSHTLWPASARPEIERALEEARGGGTGRFSGFCPTVKGTPKWWDVIITPIFGPDGRPSRLIAASRDITGQKHVEEVLFESEARYRAMFDASSVGKVEVDPRTFRFLRANAAYCQLTGYSEAELHDLTVFDITHPDDRERNRAGVQRLMAGEAAAFDLDKRYIRKDGGTVWTRVTINLIRDGQGQPLRVIAAIADISAGKQAEEALRKSEERFRFVTARAEVGRWDWDLEADRLEWSALCKQLFGLPPDEPMSYARFLAAIHPSDRGYTDRAVRACLESGGAEDYDIEYRAIWPDGTVRWIHAKGSALFENGRAVRMAGIALNITARKKAEEQIRHSQRQLQMALEASQAGIWGWNALTNESIWDDRHHALYGFEQGAPRSFDAWVGRLHPDDRDRVLARLEAMLATPSDNDWREEFRILHPSRGECWMLNIGRAERDASGKVERMAGIVLDITERKQAEEALRKSEVLFRSIFENAAVGIAHIAPDGRWLRVNERLCEITGYTADELTTKTFQDITYPGDLEADLAQTRRLLAGEIDSFGMDKRYIRKDGSIVWIRLAAGCVRKPDHSVDYFVSVIEDIGALKAAEEALRESERQLAVEAEELAKLNTLSSRLWRMPSTQEGIEEMLEATIDMLGADMGNVQLLQGGVLRIAAQRGFSQEFLDFFREVSTEDDSGCERALRSGARTMIEDVEADELYAPMRAIARSAGYRAVQSTPLIGRDGKPRGMISTHWRLPHRPSEGEFRHLDLYARLAESFIERCEAEEALRQSEERYHGIYDHAGTGIAVVDPSGKILSCNPAYCRMLGYREAELRGTSFKELFHPDEADASLLEIERLLAGEIPAFETFGRCVGKSGEEIWAHKFIALMRGRDHRPTNIIVLVTDLTERKRHEERVEFLLREVNHRAKNLLTIVQAIATQTAARDPAEFIDKFSQRLQALSANQDLLVRSDWRGIGLNDLVRGQLAHFADPERIAVDGPPLWLTASAAQAIGLALHELATNAAKYGALSSKRGRIDIGWRLEGGNFILNWKERGGPRVSPPMQHGFGTIVIDTMTKLSTKGTVTLDYAASGLKWRLTCPAAHVVEQDVG